MITPYLYLGDGQTDYVWWIEDDKVWAVMCYSDLVSQMSAVGRVVPVDMSPRLFDVLVACHTDDTADIATLFKLTPAELADITARQIAGGKTNVLHEWDPVLVPLIGWSDDEDEDD